ncbi:YitT family protein [Melissococcus plutonius]|uniref:UPF0750 membrane protein YvjA n=1 Tax=Melissococcus plutonius TaxID=33970 RepID=A0A2Z5Y1M4_9ENTE|nr:YitT family protein [Melissococcus plutonius]BAL61824.1 hypothetical protein MPD5_0555 [Melissococcus plutonius DAT561]MCV2499359.1 YitT family protein [Melissococcus plutonius]MCV2501589.1 YitT family protein [Melissococcus plutonius]MCV2505694.1 YitT family protein [Melissococcus plutonius]MCV2507877.1 YitT family protein [Melissococcus plutonius]
MKKVIMNKKVKELLFVTLGSLVLAVSINSILLPNALVAGGANGISIVLNHLFGWNIALVLYAINIPLLLLCFLLLGKEVGIKTIYGSLVYPFFVGLTGNIPVLTHNILLAAIYGGILTGLGLGLEFKGNASTGGTAIISQIAHKYTKLPMGICVSIVDGMVILGALFAFNVNIVLFSLICLFIIGRVIDFVQAGLGRYKNLLVVSSKSLEIRATLIRELDKGVTIIPIEGGYQQEGKVMLMTVIKEKDYSAIQEKILEIDDQAFIVSMTANEVKGRGFSIQRILGMDQ